MKLAIALMMGTMTFAQAPKQEKPPVHPSNPNWEYVHKHHECRIVGDPYPPSRGPVMVDGKVRMAAVSYGWAAYVCSGIDVIVTFDERGRPDAIPEPKPEPTK